MRKKGGFRVIGDDASAVENEGREPQQASEGLRVFAGDDGAEVRLHVPEEPGYAFPVYNGPDNEWSWNDRSLYAARFDPIEGPPRNTRASIKLMTEEPELVVHTPPNRWK